VSGCEDATSCVYHPVGDLAHAEAGRMTELFLLFLTWIRMVRVTMEPGLEVIGGFLWEFASLALWTINEGGGRH